MTKNKGSFVAARWTKFSAQEWNAILAWPVIREQLAAREENGFATQKVVVEGASFDGPVLMPQLTAVQAQVFFEKPDGVASSYRMSFLDEGASLLVAFRVGARLAGEPQALRGSETYVVMVEQPRYAANLPHALEVPAGRIKQYDKTREHSALAAWREFSEECLCPEARTFFQRLGVRDIKSLGEAVALIPSSTQCILPYYAELSVSRDEFRKLRAVMEGSKCGVEAEGEGTVVRIMPLNEALIKTMNEPYVGNAFQMLSRYAHRRGTLSFVAPR